jgi:hypothetical protein
MTWYLSMRVRGCDGKKEELKGRCERNTGIRPRRGGVVAEVASRTFDRGGGVPALLVYWRRSGGDGRERVCVTKDEMERVI